MTRISFTIGTCIVGLCLTVACGPQPGATPVSAGNVGQLRGAPLNTMSAALPAASNKATPDTTSNTPGADVAPADNASDTSPTPATPVADGTGATDGTYREMRFEALTQWQFLVHPLDKIMEDPELGKLHNPVPESIKALDGTRISVPGYPLPEEGEDPAACRRFVLCHLSVRCCFGRPPQQHDFIHCEMAGDRTASFNFDGWPVRARGVLHVGVEYDDDGHPTKVYRMTVDDCATDRHD
ncbi:MAG: hypothetical protein AB7K09_06380 [Planctomycetota bacterium]